MNIYEIDQKIQALIDPETGELMDFDAFEALQMAREEKLENAALWYKNLTASAAAIREEEKALAERRKAAERKAESLKSYIGQWLNGDKFSTAKVAVSWRTSRAVEITDETAFLLENSERDDLVSFTPKIIKSAVSDALKRGETLTGVEIVEKQNLQIK